MKKSQGFCRIDAAIKKTAQEKKLTEAVNRYKAARHWEDVVSGFISEAKGCSKVVTLRNGVLVVACLSKELAYKIKMLSKRIIETLNQIIGQQAIFGIFIET